MGIEPVDSPPPPIAESHGATTSKNTGNVMRKNCRSAELKGCRRIFTKYSKLEVACTFFIMLVFRGAGWQPVLG